MPLANPIVARLAARKPGWAAKDHCGLVLVTNWPAAAHVCDKYDQMRKALAAALPECAYLYPPSTLHCTVATLRAFTGGPLDGADRDTETTRWRAVLDAARAMPEWPKGKFKLRLGAPLLEGAAGIVKYEEVGGTAHIEAMRACVRKAILAAGGVAAEGSEPRDKARALPGTAKDEPAPHIPNIVHSTVLRWAAEPTSEQLAAAHAAFKAVAATWEPVELTVGSGALAVYEDVPFMHISHDKEQIFWRSEQPPASKLAKGPPQQRGYLSLLLEVLVTFLLPLLLVLAVTALSGPTRKNKPFTYWYLPGKPQATWPPHPWAAGSA